MSLPPNEASSPDWKPHTAPPFGFLEAVVVHFQHVELATGGGAIGVVVVGTAVPSQ